MKKLNLKLPKGGTFLMPAAVWKRALAFIADLLVINLVIGFPFRGILERVIPQDMNILKYTLEGSQTAALTAVSVSLSILTILYFSILEYKLDQSVGKILFNIYVMNDKKKKSFWQYLVRSMFLLPFMPFVALWLADPSYMLFNRENRRFTEVLSKTKVVEVYKG